MASDKRTDDSGSGGVSGQGVAALLRASRLRHGEEIKEIARALRIRLVYLVALEEGRWHELPGTTYAVGFLRAYAEYLGLDSVEVIRRFRTECEDAQRKTHLQFPAPVTERSVPGGAILLISVVLAAVAYGGWYLLADRDRDKVETVPPLPDRLAQMIGKPAAKAPAPAGEAASPTESSASAPVVEPIKPESTVEAAKPVETAAPPKPVEAAPAPSAAPPPGESAPPPEATSGMSGTNTMSGSAKIYGAADGPSRIVLKAKQDSWIQVRDETAGKLIATRLLRAGESFRVPDQPGLTLTTGNAGALEVTVDGEIVPAVGGSGIVKRGIALDAERLREGKASGE